MNIMTYKGLTARVEFDAQDEILVGRIAGINDVVGFHAEDAKGIVAAFHEAVDDYIATCKEVGKEPEKTYSGKLMLRISPELHRNLAVTAELSGKSLNQLGEDILSAGTKLGYDSYYVGVDGNIRVASAKIDNCPGFKGAAFAVPGLPSGAVILPAFLSSAAMARK